MAKFSVTVTRTDEYETEELKKKVLKMSDDGLDEQVVVAAIVVNRSVLPPAFVHGQVLAITQEIGNLFGYLVQTDAWFGIGHVKQGRQKVEDPDGIGIVLQVFVPVFPRNKVSGIAAILCRINSLPQLHPAYAKEANQDLAP